jgi:hypothetical protein
MTPRISTGKTTVTFPVYLIQALRAYMLRENISAHKQSDIVAQAVHDFLLSKDIKLPPADGKTYEYVVTLRESDARDVA